MTYVNGKNEKNSTIPGSACPEGFIQSDHHLRHSSSRLAARIIGAIHLDLWHYFTVAMPENIFFT